MERMLINASQRDEKRVAIVSENVLYDFITERPGFEQKIGNIYLAKITSIEPSLDAVFVDYGSERHGFLPLKEISREYFINRPDQEGRMNIRELLRVGQEIMIQVEKEERGNKGAALTTYISLAGSYLVLMPNSPRAGGISRRIEGDERDQLREILNQVSVPDGMGLIVRTAAIGRTNDELKWDLEVLLSHWNNIVAAAKTRSAPFLIHQEGNVVIRAIRDYVRQDTAEIIIDDETEFQNAKHYLEQIRPDVADRVKLYSDPTPLFSRYGIEHQIETAYKRTIDLPSGASIVIDYTEALVSIDVNSARATKGRNIESTAFNTNLEAAKEIARQLRLRDIGGLIVIDFIDMIDPSNQVEVEKHLSRALKNDRARIQLQRISRFGLLEMSRQRLRPSLRDSHQHVCPTCSGHGTIRSVDSVALTLVRIIEEEALKPQTSEIVVQASTEAATYLLNEKRHLLAGIEKNHDVKVSVIPNPNLQSSNFIKKRIRVSDVDESGLASSDRLQVAQVDINLPTAADRAAPDKPAVQQLYPTRPEKSAQSGGIMKRLWSSMFGQQDDDSEGPGSESVPQSVQSKPSYTSRAPAGKQRSRRPRSEEMMEGQSSQESSASSRPRSSSRYNENKPSDRSNQRRGEPRQRPSGQRTRPTPGKNPSTSSQFEEQSYPPKVTPAPPVAIKPPVQEPRPEEAPIKIKAAASTAPAPSKSQNIIDAQKSVSESKLESPKSTAATSQPTFTFTTQSSEPTPSSISNVTQPGIPKSETGSAELTKPVTISTAAPIAATLPPITSDGFIPSEKKLKESTSNESAQKISSVSKTNLESPAWQTKTPTETVPSSASTTSATGTTTPASTATQSSVQSTSATTPYSTPVVTPQKPTSTSATTVAAAPAQTVAPTTDNTKLSSAPSSTTPATDNPTAAATPAKTPSTTTGSDVTTEASKTTEQQKPLIIRATTDEKTSESTDKEKTD